MSVDHPNAPDTLQSELDRIDSNVTGALAQISEIKDRLDHLESHVDDLDATVDVLDERAPRPGRQEYDAMDREDKATVVRSKLKQEAEATGGCAAVTYSDVVRMFDGRPSAGHAYDIMETAAEGDGYDLGTDPEGTKRLTFKTGRVKP